MADPLQHVMFFKIKEKKTSNKGFDNGRHESPSSLCILAKSSDNGDPLPAHDFLKKRTKQVPLWFGTCDVLAKSLDFFWPKATMASSHK
jgi:hypothetical protein